MSMLCVLIVWIWRRRIGHGVCLKQVAVPMLVVLILAGAATAYYCWRVTGSPLRLPQQLNRDTYATAKYFYWQAPYPKRTYHNAAMRDFYEGVELPHVNAQHSFKGLLLGAGLKVGSWWVFYIGPALTIPLFFIPRVISDRRTRPLLIALGACLAGNAIVAFYGPHYSAPVAGATVAVVVQGMRHLRRWKLGAKPVGVLLVRAVVLISIVMVPVELRLMQRLPQPGSWQAMGPARTAVLSKLSTSAGGQLVLVRYAPNHDPLAEWVYNDADIDRAHVVWARDMGSIQNEELLRYYNDRRVWLLDADDVTPRLIPYPCTLSVKAQVCQ
jgi:hypothetical protein